MKSCSGPQGVTFHSSMFVDLSIVKEPTPEQKARFQRAMKKLCLEPHLEHQQMMPPHPMSDLYLLEEEKLQKTQDHEGNIVSYELSKQRPIDGRYLFLGQMNEWLMYFAVSAMQWPKLMVMACGISEKADQVEG